MYYDSFRAIYQATLSINKLHVDSETVAALIIYFY